MEKFKDYYDLQIICHHIIIYDLLIILLKNQQFYIFQGYGLGGIRC